MKVTPKTSNAGSGSAPEYLETLTYTVELTGAELYALRSVARHISRPPDTTTRKYTDQLASLDIPGLPDPDDGPRWHEGLVTAKRLSDLGDSEVESPNPEGWWNPAGAPEPGTGFRFLTKSEHASINPSTVAEFWHDFRRRWELRAYPYDELSPSDTYRVPLDWSGTAKPEPAGFRAGTTVRVTGGSITSGDRVPEPGQLARVCINDGSDIPYFLRSLWDQTYSGWFSADAVEAVEWWNPAEPDPEHAKPTTPNWFENGDKVRIIGPTYGGSSVFAGRSGTVIGVDRTDPDSEYKIRTDDDNTRWFPSRSLAPAVEPKPADDIAPAVEPKPADDIAPGFNPARLTRAEVDPKNEGWRLLTQAEVSACTQPDASVHLDPEGFEFPGFPDTQYNMHDGWSRAGEWHAYPWTHGVHGTLRTMHPEGYYLTRRTGFHNPAKLTPSQVGDGWRLLTVSEVDGQGFWPNSQYWHTGGGWSKTGRWRAHHGINGTLRVRE